MRRADARSRQYLSPEGVTFACQVSVYSIEPPAMVVKGFASRELLGELVGPGELTCLNRDNESSLKLSADNFCGCDLLPEDGWRATDADEPMELWPQVPLVFNASSRAGAGEWLAGAGAGPCDDIPSVVPRKTEGKFPPADSGEPVNSCESPNVIWGNICN